MWRWWIQLEEYSHSRIDHQRGLNKTETATGSSPRTTKICTKKSNFKGSTTPPEEQLGILVLSKISDDERKKISDALKSMSNCSLCIWHQSKVGLHLHYWEWSWRRLHPPLLHLLKQFYWRFFAWFAFLQSSKQTFDHWKKKSKARKICLWQISDVHQNSSILPFSLHFWEISKFSNLILNILWLVLSLRYVNDAWLKVYQVATYIKKKKEKQSLFCILEEDLKKEFLFCIKPFDLLGKLHIFYPRCCNQSCKATSKFCLHSFQFFVYFNCI